MKDLAIFGAGGLGREVASMLVQKWYRLPHEDSRFIGFFDDGISEGTQIASFGQCLGGADALNAWTSPIDVVLAIGSPQILKIVRNKITNPLVEFPNLISWDFTVTDKSSFQIGEGNIIHGLSAATTNVKIGNFNLLNSQVMLGHDVTIGDFNVFMPGSRISGEVTIGDGCLFGAMSFVIQQLKVADGVKLSPLSTLLTKPKPGGTYMGNPARLMKF